MKNNDEIILYQPDNSIRLEVRLENETVWINRQQMSLLFDRDIKTIGKHINNALKEELAGFSVVANFATTATDGKTYQVEHYNLDMILSVGYRVKSDRGIQFRIWANHILKVLLSKRSTDIDATIYTAHISQQLQLDLQRHNSQYQLITVRLLTRAHDRFLFIDDDVYHIGASLKDLGKKLFAFSKMELKSQVFLQNHKFLFG
jgi:hypothetical protein